MLDYQRVNNGMLTTYQLVQDFAGSSAVVGSSTCPSCRLSWALDLPSISTQGSGEKNIYWLMLYTPIQLKISNIYIYTDIYICIYAYMYIMGLFFKQWYSQITYLWRGFGYWNNHRCRGQNLRPRPPSDDLAIRNGVYIYIYICIYVNYQIVSNFGLPNDLAYGLYLPQIKLLKHWMMG